MFIEFINQYGMDILYTIVMAIAGYVGIVIKNLVNKYINDKTKQDVARTVVQFVEQVYKDLHGEDKLNAAIAAASDMFVEKGIHVSDLEMRVLLEAAVAEFNKAFQKTEPADAA
jgi:tyrosyl-tRNA synthetase